MAIQEQNQVVAVIPSLNPDEKLLSVVRGLVEEGFSRILLINDGSDPSFLPHFEECTAYKETILLTHETNRGKGAALRTAFSYVLDHFPDAVGVVTLDGDAQHRPSDVKACAEALKEQDDTIILGVRDFSLPHVPKKSRMGNRITSFVFKFFCHLSISDTQTGLRAIPMSLLSDMLQVTGDRYEYETNMLLAMGKKKIPYREVKIETVYIEQNQTSHFRPFRDSYRIYKLIFGQLVKYGLSSVGCLLAETLFQTILHDFWEISFSVGNGFLSTFLVELCDFLPARFLSSILNYFINKKFVFTDGKPRSGSLIRYYFLWTIQAIVTALSTNLLVYRAGGASGVSYFLLSIFVKVLIFFSSYIIQKRWVFSEKSSGKGKLQ